MFAFFWKTEIFGNIDPVFANDSKWQELSGRSLPGPQASGLFPDPDCFTDLYSLSAS